MTQHEYLDKIALLRKHCKAYYNPSEEPTIPDAVYDQLVIEVREIEARHPHWVVSHSPTQTVGEKPIGDTVAHTTPKLSLKNAFSVDEIVEWLKTLPTDSFVSLEYKLDGLTLVATYLKGVLTTLATRGDGLVGQSIPVKAAAAIRGLPPELPMAIDLEVTGELLMPRSRLAELQHNGSPLKNTRNGISGALRSAAFGDFSKLDDRHATFMAFTSDTGDAATHNEEDYHFYRGTGLRELYIKALSGVVVPTEDLIAGSVSGYIKMMGQLRQGYPFDTDGLVFKAVDHDVRVAMGATSTEPRWARAYKYPAAIGITDLESVEFQVGRTGAITPVAILKPITLGGVTISRANLYNADEIEHLNLKIGAKVNIARMGEVIPRLVAAEGGTDPIVFPTLCPSCGTHLVRDPDAVGYYCPASHGCPAQFLEALAHFVGKKGLDIKGLGKATLQNLVECGLVQRTAGLFELSPGELAASMGCSAEVAARTVFAELERVCDGLPLARFITAIGIPGVEQGRAEILAEAHSLSELFDATVESLMTIPDIGEGTAKRVVAYLKANRHTVELLNEFIHITRPNQVPRTGAVWVLTGSFPESKDAIKAKLKSHGIVVKGSVSKNTSVVLVGTDAGKKAKDAEKYGIQTLSYEDYKQRYP